MDVDKSFSISISVSDHTSDVKSQAAPVSLSAAPTISVFQPSLYKKRSPTPEKRPLKRRSLSPEASPRHAMPQITRHSQESTTTLDFFQQESSSSPAPPSPSERKFERFSSTGGGLFKALKNAAAEKANVANSNTRRLRRPTVSALVNSESHSTGSLNSFADQGVEPCMKAVPQRRAFSAMLAPMTSESLESEADTSFEVDPSSPAVQALAKRQNARTVRRRDGTDDFRPFAAGGLPLRQRDSIIAAPSPIRKVSLETSKALQESPSARWFKGSNIPGFGDNEAHGKILPCERVPEDGLMRIDCKTVCAFIHSFVHIFNTTPAQFTLKRRI